MAANVATAVRAAEVIGTIGVADAEVWLEERPDIRTRTKADGTYVLENVPTGTFRVVAK